MSPKHPQSLTYADLDRLDAEVLPQRLAMSALRGDGHGTTVVAYACSASYSAGTTGLLGTGLFAQPAYSSMTCMPATVVTKD
ncbi:hypothetical protein BZB76_4543 [Actinomadura pelletieri DSM 43383]|uniref:Uncharacterized protein n=1 Tax=Actinomadura pelletieri DSM 43383 TaxID=1120940 RepID=A0A495QI58_9ACTN|nr:hypothetical protein [Actinomadura pelletieri]RKS71736.1 hypothetical protein BZB76_4543 [Actinomadura pelletieri DSM 43383]